jgi:hypothetical protein
MIASAKDKGGGAIDKKRLRFTRIRRLRWQPAAPVFRAACRFCRREVEMITPEQAAGFLEIPLAALQDLVGAGRVHSVALVSGGVRICKDSLVEGQGFTTPD